MVVRCTNTEIGTIEDIELREHIRCHVHQEDIGLEKGNKYVVFGLLFRNGHVWYFLCDEESAEYPKPYNSAFFEKVDNSLPGDWVLLDDCPPSVVPREWAVIPNFLEKLVEGEPAAEAQFQAIKLRLL